jgi:hypothetical protein
LRPLADFVRERVTALQPDEVLAQKIEVLLGVGASAASALRSGLGIDTVFDLATSRSLGAARRAILVNAKLLPADVFVQTSGIGGDVGALPLVVLRALDADTAQALTTATGARTLAELVNWAPYVAAQRVLRDAYTPEGRSGLDDLAPSDLLPLAGALPQEWRTYQRLLIDSPSVGSPNAPAIETAGAVDITTLQDGRFTRAAFGALLTFSQSWFTQGVALGQLLHSLSLAPGESTRMAMVDWSRRVRGNSSESVGETEALDNTLQQARAVNEVTEATATEMQSGVSLNQGTSKTSESGSANGFEIGPLAMGNSGGSSRTETKSMTATSSLGSRDLAARTAQQINEATQQHASASRSRRASVVREVSQSEHETLTTRVVTNYNHMHTLNLQYYEVVQAYRVTTRLERAERCIFVPLQPLDFGDPEMVERWRAVLLKAALSPAVKQQLERFNTVLVRSVYTPPRLWKAFARAERIAKSDVLAAQGATVISAGTGAPSADAASATRAAEASIPEPGSPPDWKFEGVDRHQLSKLIALGARLWYRPGHAAISLPQGTLLTGLVWPSDLAASAQLLRDDGSGVALVAQEPLGARLGTPESLRRLASLVLQPRLPTEVSFVVTLQLSVDGTLQTLSMPVRLPAATRFLSGQAVVAFDDPDDDTKLTTHLRANAMHYSHAIFATLDDAAIATLLGRHTMAGIPLAQWVDHQPVAVFANCLVFKANLPNSGASAEAALQPLTRDWQAFLATSGLNTPSPRSELVALPTGGVFAEGVLGRANTAERLDLTRFWNWQDSPIPIVASEIGPLSAGSRADDVGLQAGALSTPLVSQMAPSVLPDPIGLAQTIAALQSNLMFRDMSALAQTAAVAQAMQGVSTDGAINAGQQAAETLKTVMTQRTERLRIAAELAATMAGVPPVGALGGATGGESAGVPGAAASDTSLSEQGGQVQNARTIDANAGTQSGPPTSQAAAVLRQQSGVSAQMAIDQVIGAATPTPGAATSRVNAASTSAQPFNVALTITVSSLLSDPAVFVNAPVGLQLELSEPDGTKLLQKTDTAAQGPFVARVRTTFNRIHLFFGYQVETNWAVPTVLSTNSNLAIPIDGRDRLVSVFVKRDSRSTDLGPGAEMPTPAQLAGMLNSRGVDTRRVLRLPVLSRSADGNRVATYDFLVNVVPQLSN